MQIKTTLRFYLTIIKNTTTNKCYKILHQPSSRTPLPTNAGEDAGKKNPHILLVGV
jgi:hypothetical protein